MDKGNALCLFVCEYVTTYSSLAFSADVCLKAQYDPVLPEENRFAEATPIGDLKVRITNPKLSEFFKPGKKYLMAITEAE